MATLIQALPDVAARCDPSTRLSFEHGRTIVWLSGEHDIATAWMVADILARAIALDEADLIVDLSETDFMGSCTAAMLLRARTLLVARNRTLIVRAPSRSARRVIELFGAGSLIGPTAETGAPILTVLQSA